VTQYELENLWIKSSIPGVAYRFGDKVRVTSGEQAGEVGRIVALLAVEPSPMYVIELPSGKGLTLLQSDLELMEVTTS
jgi:hypothetical protein